MKNKRFEQIPIQYIELNENNPRGIYNPYEDDEFNRLCESIDKFGILIPLIVKQINESCYLLIDGERRYNAALKTKNNIVPAYIMEDNEIDKTANYIITMQNIHSNRKAWSPGAQHKITEMIQKIIEEELAVTDDRNLDIEDEDLKDSIKTKSKQTSNNDIKVNISGPVVSITDKAINVEEIKNEDKNVKITKEDTKVKKIKVASNEFMKKVATGVAKKTGMTREKAYESVLFSEWPEEIKNEIWSNKGSRTLFSHIISIEKTFIQPLRKYYPNFVERVGLNEIRTNLFIKIKNEALGPALGYRELSFLFKNIKENKSEILKLEDLLYSFIYTVELDIIQVKAKYYNLFTNEIYIDNLSEEEFIYQLNYFIAIIDEIDVTTLTKDNNTKAIEKMSIIENKLKKVFSE